MKYHFISIGGAVMHNMALDLHKQGHSISGSDDEIFEPAHSRLKEKGLLPEKIGWFPEKITKDIDAVILGMHARVDNPELLRAQELGVKIYSFPEFIYEHSKDKIRVVIGGSHGKTTTTAMIMHVLKYLNKDFDYLVGSAIKGFDTMVRLSNAPLIILEGDEYLTSALDRRPKFLVYKADIALITGIAWDHINVFPTFENYLEQFRLFIEQLPNDAPIAYFEEDEELSKLLKPHEKRLKLLNYDTLPYKMEGGDTILTTMYGDFKVQVFGKHNLQNMGGAKLICNQLGISNQDFFKAITHFAGTARRLEKMKETGSFMLYRDFAHSPSKVKATVLAIREQFPDKKIVVCFELHTYSSLNREFLDGYRDTLNAADTAIVYFNEHVFGLKNMPVLDEAEVKNAFGGNVLVYTDTTKLYDCLKALPKENMVLLMMSSGNFDDLPIDTL